METLSGSHFNETRLYQDCVNWLECGMGRIWIQLGFMSYGYAALLKVLDRTFAPSCL